MSIRSIQALLLAIALAANVPTNAFAGSLLDMFAPAPTCSTDPDHGRNEYIDFTAGESASHIFHDPRAAALADAAKRNATVPEHDHDPTPNADNGRTVVHYAAMIENPAFLEMLLAHHVSPDVRTANGDVPLDESILAGCDIQFHRLIAAHANLSAPNQTGDTPLHVAVLTNSFDRALDLLNAGANGSNTLIVGSPGIKCRSNEPKVIDDITRVEDG